MKGSIIILLAGFLIFILSQQSQAQDFEFGIKGGLNFSNINVDGGRDPDGKVGVHLGVFGMANIGSDDALFIQPELQFSLLGWEDVNLTYITLPVVIKYYVVEQLSFHAGLQLGLLIAGEDDVDEFLTTIDLGVPIGAEFDINDQLGLGLRYVVGATNIYDPDFDTTTDYYNRVFQLFVSYRF